MKLNSASWELIPLVDMDAVPSMMAEPCETAKCGVEKGCRC